jgi:hypothetical protein
MLADPDDCSFTGAVAVAVPTWWPRLSESSHAQSSTRSCNLAASPGPACDRLRQGPACGAGRSRWPQNPRRSDDRPVASAAVPLGDTLGQPEEVDECCRLRHAWSP